jgi:hypothetical protein
MNAFQLKPQTKRVELKEIFLRRVARIFSQVKLSYVTLSQVKLHYHWY